MTSDSQLDVVRGELPWTAIWFKQLRRLRGITDFQFWSSTKREVRRRGDVLSSEPLFKLKSVSVRRGWASLVTEIETKAIIS